MPQPSGRRELLSDAAIKVVADQGIRGLTHRAVDAAAGVPEGSASYYFRSRRALLEAVVIRLNYLNSIEAAPITGAIGRRDDEGEPDPITASDLDDLAHAIAILIDRWLDTGRARLLARYACEVEVVHDPELRNLLTAASDLDVQAAGIAARAGAPDAEARGRDMISCIRGLIYSRVASTSVDSTAPPGTPESRQELYTALRRVVGAFIPCTDDILLLPRGG